MKECVCVDKMSDEMVLKMAIHGMIDNADIHKLRLVYITARNIVRK